jgi:hypothetical protein
VRGGWDAAAVVEALARVRGLEPQSADARTDVKLSYVADDAIAMADHVRATLREAGLKATVVGSRGHLLDVLPPKASKGKAIKWLTRLWGVAAAQVAVAGDSGNDLEMLTGPFRGIVVGNHAPELAELRGRRGVYVAEGAYAAGVREGLRVGGAGRLRGRGAQPAPPKVRPRATVCGGDDRPLEDLAGAQVGVRADARAFADARAGREHDAGLEHHVDRERHVGVQEHARRVDHGHAGGQPAAPQPVAQQPVGLRELEPVVHADQPAGLVVGAHRAHAPAVLQVGDHQVGQVDLAGGVGVAQRRQQVPQACVEGVGAGVDLPQRPDRIVRVALLDDRAHAAVAAADDPPEPARVVRFDRQHRHPLAARVAMCGEQADERRPLDQRAVAADDDDRSRMPGERVGADATASPVPRWRSWVTNPTPASANRARTVGAVADDDEQRVRVERAGGVEHVGEQRRAGRLVQHLGEPRPHAGPLTRGQDDDRRAHAPDVTPSPRGSRAGRPRSARSGRSRAGSA